MGTRRQAANGGVALLLTVAATVRATIGHDAPADTRSEQLTVHSRPSANHHTTATSPITAPHPGTDPATQTATTTSHTAPTPPPTTTTATPTPATPPTPESATGTTEEELPGAPVGLAMGTPTEAAQRFISAASSGDVAAFRAASHASYRDTAVALWTVSESSPSGEAGPVINTSLTPPTTLAMSTSPVPSTLTPAPRVLATKVISNAAGHATVAVFVDAPDLNVAAVPYVVELVQSGDRWWVIDAGINP